MAQDHTTTKQRITGALVSVWDRVSKKAPTTESVISSPTILSPSTKKKPVFLMQDVVENTIKQCVAKNINVKDAVSYEPQLKLHLNLKETVLLRDTILKNIDEKNLISTKGARNVLIKALNMNLCINRGRDTDGFADIDVAIAIKNVPNIFATYYIIPCRNVDASDVQRDSALLDKKISSGKCVGIILTENKDIDLKTIDGQEIAKTISISVVATLHELFPGVWHLGADKLNSILRNSNIDLEQYTGLVTSNSDKKGIVQAIRDDIYVRLAADTGGLRSTLISEYNSNVAPTITELYELCDGSKLQVKPILYDNVKNGITSESVQTAMSFANLMAQQERYLAQSSRRRGVETEERGDASPSPTQTNTSSVSPASLTKTSSGSVSSNDGLRRQKSYQMSPDYVTAKEAHEQTYTTTTRRSTGSAHQEF